MVLMIILFILGGAGIVILPFIIIEVIQTGKALLYSCTHSVKDLRQFTQKQVTKLKKKAERERQKCFEKIVLKIEGEIYHRAKNGEFRAWYSVPTSLYEGVITYFKERGYEIYVCAQPTRMDMVPSLEISWKEKEETEDE